MKKVFIVFLVTLLSPLLLISTNTVGGVAMDVDFVKAIKFVSRVLGVVAMAMGVGCLAVGLFKFAVSAGDPKTVSEAKTFIVWSAIAVAVGAILWQADKVYSLITTGSWTGN